MELKPGSVADGASCIKSTDLNLQCCPYPPPTYFPKANIPIYFHLDLDKKHVKPKSVPNMTHSVT